MSEPTRSLRRLSWAAALVCAAVLPVSAQGLGGGNAPAPAQSAERGQKMMQQAPGPQGAGAPDRARGPTKAAESAKPQRPKREAQQKSAPKREKSQASKQSKSPAKKVQAEAKKSKAKAEKTAKQAGDKAKQKDSSKSAAASDKDDDAKSGKTASKKSAEAKQDDSDAKAKPERSAAKDSDAKRASADRKPAKEVKTVELAGEKKTRVKRAFDRPDARRDRVNVDVDIYVGRRLPSRWHYHPVPTAVIEVVPAYRGYVYVYSGDRYIICEPDTYEVVAVIDAPPSRHASSGGDLRCTRDIALSSDERYAIVDEVEDTRRVDVRDLDIGWSVPQSIELHRFPDRVVDRTGELRACRYFVAEDDVAVVDPDEEKVVLLIEAD